MSRRLPVIAASLALAACGASTVNATNASPRPLSPRPVTSVAVFSSSRPTRPFVEIAILKAQRPAAYAAAAGTNPVATLRTEAARIGCDAIVINGTADTVVHSGRGASTSSTLIEGFWGSCIVYTDVPASPLAVAPADAPPPPTKLAAVLLRLFDRLDRDRDGVLAPAEMPIETAYRLLALDGNQDGWVTRAEVITSTTEAYESRPVWARERRTP